MSNYSEIGNSRSSAVSDSLDFLLTVFVIVDNVDHDFFALIFLMSISMVPLLAFSLLRGAWFHAKMRCQERS